MSHLTLSVQVFMNNFFQIARAGKNSFWRYTLTECIAVAFFLLGMTPLIIVMIQSRITSPLITPTMLGISPAMFLALNLLPFAFAGLGLVLAMPYVHKRPFLSLITPSTTVNLRKIGFAMALWFGLSLLSDTIAFVLNPENYIWSFQAAEFFPIFIVALLLIPLQASIEELFFRGYLMQCVGLTSRRVFIPLLVVTALFSCAHILNPEMQSHGMTQMMISYTLVGLLLGVATIMDESLELAIGIHIANNLYGVTVVSIPSSALVSSPLVTQTNLLPTQMNVQLFIMTCFALAVFAKKYRWGSLARLWERVSPREGESTSHASNV